MVTVQMAEGEKYAPDILLSGYYDRSMKYPGIDRTKTALVSILYKNTGSFKHTRTRLVSSQLIAS